MAKKVTRIATEEKKRFYGAGDTEIHYFLPIDPYGFKENGLDCEYKIGRTDFNKLGRPNRIRVTLTALPDDE